MERSSRRFQHIIILLLLLLGLSVPNISRPAAASTPQSGVIIPLYTYPGATWSSVIKVKEANPTVPIVAVINPDNGPGSAQDPNYVSGIKSLQAAGVTVLGYVFTSNGARSLSSVEADVATYKSWYHVNGIFFDEMANVPGFESYYSTLGNYADSLGFTFTVGNPGAPVPASYVGTLDCIIIYENSGTPTVPVLSTATMGLSKNDFALLAYGVGTLDSTYEVSISDYVGYLYLTDAALPNPYSSLPSYFTTLVSALDAPIQNVPITVKSETTNGSASAGVPTVVQYNGTVVASGPTPLTFYATPGAEYTISVTNYASYTFNHWGSGGSTSPVTTITAAEPTTLTAFYSPAQYLINVQSITQTGTDLLGMHTVVTSNGTVVASGFTPFSFYGTAGSQYTVSVSNYGSYSFSHWLDSGTNPSSVLTLTQDTWLTAAYTASPLG